MCDPRRADGQDAQSEGGRRWRGSWGARGGSFDALTALILAKWRETDAACDEMRRDASKAKKKPAVVPVGLSLDGSSCLL